MKLSFSIPDFLVPKAYRDTLTNQRIDADPMLKPDPAMRMIQLKKGTPPPKDHKSLIERYAGWSYICANRNAASLASVPLKLYATRATGQEKAGRGVKAIGQSISKKDMTALQTRFPRHKALQAATEVEQITEHPLLDLLTNVNPIFNHTDVFEATSTFLDCVGNSYWYVPVDGAGRPTQFWLLMSQWMFVVPDTQKYVKGYLYGLDQRTQVAFEPQDIIHFRTPNPLSQFYGLGCIEAVLAAVDRYKAMDDYEKSLNDNMGVPSLWINYKTGTLDEKKRIELENQWNARFRGVKKAGKVAVTDFEWDVKEIGLAPREMGFSEGRRWTRLEIADAFGVPLALLDTENVNLANAQTALYQYMKFAIQPRLKRFEEKLNERLVPMYEEPRLLLAFDNCVPADQEFELRRDTAYIASNVYTVNEVRQRLGLDPVEWGDEPVRQAAPEPMTEDDTEETPDKPDKAAKSVKTHSHKANGGVAPLTTNQRRLGKGVRALFTMQESAALKWVTDHREAFSSGKSASRPGLPERIWEHEWDGVCAKLTHEAIETEFKSGGRRAMRDLRKRIKPKKALPKIDLMDEQHWIDDPRVGDYVRAHTMKFAKAINKRTHDELRDILADGFDAGLGVDEMRDQIKDLFQGYDDYRVDRISRTETARAEVGGMRSAFKDSGVVSGMAWLADEAACEFCKSINGKVVSIDKPFFKQGDTIRTSDGKTMTLDYGETEGPPLHPNCRCTLIPEIIDAPGGD